MSSHVTSSGRLSSNARAWSFVVGVWLAISRLPSVQSCNLLRGARLRQRRIRRLSRRFSCGRLHDTGPLPPATNLGPSNSNEVHAMKRLTAATALLALTLSAPASAHHSQSMFDTTKEIVIEGTVARFDWVNPHMYLVVATKGPDGAPALVEGEGVGITQALVDGLDRNALQVGTPVVVRANPHRGGWGKQVRIMDVTTQDGEVHPFYAANTRTRVLKPAESLEGHWAPSRAAFGAAMGALARWPVTAAGRAAQAAAVDDGVCNPDSPPVLSVFDELRTIELGQNEVVLQFDNT